MSLDYWFYISGETVYDTKDIWIIANNSDDMGVLAV